MSTEDIAWLFATILKNTQEFVVALINAASGMPGEVAFVVGALTGIALTWAVYTYAMRAVTVIVLTAAGAAGLNLPRILSDLIHAWQATSSGL